MLHAIQFPILERGRPMEDMSSKDIDTRDGYNQWSATYEQPALETERMNLEPITETHAQELRDLFSDQKLHHFVPFEPLTLEQQGERCARWAKRQSPDGNEVWLNWAGRDRVSKQVIAHFQSGIKRDGVASVGYLVAEVFQNKGYASEGLEVVFRYLNDHLNVHEPTFRTLSGQVSNRITL
jgi:RimJ/RimL family protein N-acetyltransferase